LTDLPQPPSVERLEALRNAAREGDPILFVYGPGTDDAFIDTAYHICGIEEALWEALHGAGFARIGFYSLTRKLYFRDATSLRGARARRGAAHAQGVLRPARRPDHRRGEEP
jgi:hypothetical protein